MSSIAHLKSEVAQAQSRLAAAVAAGSARDWGEYQLLVGRFNALTIVQNYIEDLQDREQLEKDE